MAVNYQLELERELQKNEGKTPRLLLHCCCAPCCKAGRAGSPSIGCNGPWRPGSLIWPGGPCWPGLGFAGGSLASTWPACPAMAIPPWARCSMTWTGPVLPPLALPAKGSTGRGSPSRCAPGRLLR